MNPFEAVAIMGTFSIIGLTMFGITKAITNAWARRLPDSSENCDRLVEAVEQLQNEVDTLRGELACRMDELEERADFSEHFLEGSHQLRRADSKSKVIGLTPI